MPKTKKRKKVLLKDPLRKDMRTAKHAQTLGKLFAAGSRQPATSKEDRRLRLVESKLAALNLIEAAKARGRLVSGTSSGSKPRKKRKAK